MSEGIEHQLERIADGLERLIGFLEAGGGFRRVLTIKAGETLPDAAAAPDLGNPFEMAGELQLQRLHKGGRAVYGNAWQATGPQLVFAYSDGRTDRSPELSHDEAERMIADLTAQQE